jgi:predicted RNase H-like nuclease
MKRELVIAQYASFPDPVSAAMRDCTRLLKRWKKSGKARDLIEYEATAEAFHILSTRAKRQSVDRQLAMRRLQKAGLVA